MIHVSGALHNFSHRIFLSMTLFNFLAVVPLLQAIAQIDGGIIEVQNVSVKHRAPKVPDVEISTTRPGPEMLLHIRDTFFQDPDFPLLEEHLPTLALLEGAAYQDFHTNFLKQRARKDLNAVDGKGAKKETNAVSAAYNAGLAKSASLPLSTEHAPNEIDLDFNEYNYAYTYNMHWGATSYYYGFYSYYYFNNGFTNTFIQDYGALLFERYPFVSDCSGDPAVTSVLPLGECNVYYYYYGGYILVEWVYSANTIFALYWYSYYGGCHFPGRYYVYRLVPPLNGGNMFSCNAGFANPIYNNQVSAALSKGYLSFKYSISSSSLSSDYVSSGVYAERTRYSNTNPSTGYYYDPTNYACGTVAMKSLSPVATCLGGVSIEWPLVYKYTARSSSNNPHEAYFCKGDRYIHRVMSETCGATKDGGGNYLSSGAFYQTYRKLLGTYFKQFHFFVLIS